MTNTGESGFDLPLTGLDDGTFLSIHILALCCICTSFLCVLLILVTIFRDQHPISFFTWTKGKRLVVYSAICDGLFNLVHALDHLQIVITRDHVRPPALCVIYGAVLAEFVAAQILMVNIVCINAFILIYFKKNINFGRYDNKLLLWTFGVPSLFLIVYVSLGTFGTNGLYCGFDRLNGKLAHILFLTIPLCLILVINIILYTLTWFRIRTEERMYKKVRGKEISNIRASHRAARSMSLFVVAFFLQWSALAVFGILPLVQDDQNDQVRRVFDYFTTSTTNIGGILNGAVYLIICKRSSTTNASSE